MTTTDPTPLAEQIAREHHPERTTGAFYRCGRCKISGLTVDAYAAHIATVTERAALREAAQWLAATDYPAGWHTDARVPDALWEAFVDVVHEDEDGRWHGNELTRDDVESWMAQEAGRIANGAPDA